MLSFIVFVDTFSMATVCNGGSRAANTDQRFQLSTSLHGAPGENAGMEEKYKTCVVVFRAVLHLFSQ